MPELCYIMYSVFINIQHDVDSQVRQIMRTTRCIYGTSGTRASLQLRWTADASRSFTFT